jgi:lipopolysaccharide transport system ATP-binding protein
MSDIAIKVEDVSKMYRLGALSSGSLVSDVNRFIAKARGKEDPYSVIGTNDRTTKGNSEFVWSLRDIHFDIKRGDAVGIIGRNGAGKSTLLKILSRVTAPTTGSIKIKGRVASLLEVGTGFHPELSGRDNIFMNGVILGMSRNEIKTKFDEIVDFAGVEKYIDTPVKRYSSGMYVRLAFAVAAHLEPDILIVDEVLAVGDAEFQRKCLGKMQDVNNKEGRTVLFVSHNIASIKALCSKGILLTNGNLSLNSNIEDVIHEYQNQYNTHNTFKTKTIFPNAIEKDAQFNKIELIGEKDIHDRLEFDVFEQLWLHVHITVRKELTGTTPILCFKRDGSDLSWSFASDVDEHILDSITPGEYCYRIKLPTPLKKGIYSCELRIGKLRVADLDRVEDAVVFSIEDYSFDPTNKSFAGTRPGIVPALIKWENI